MTSPIANFCQNRFLASSLFALLASSSALAQTIDSNVELLTPWALADGAQLTVTQNGSLSATTGSAIIIAPDASVNIENAGTITATGAGSVTIQATGGGTTTTLDLTNSGDILGNYGAVYVQDTDIVHLNNKAGGLIQGGIYGIEIDTGNLSNVTNAGMITGINGSGISASTGNINNLHNLAGGMIIGDYDGGYAGIYIDTGDLTNSSNAGLIQSAYGIDAFIGSLINFSNTGTIEGLANNAINIYDGNIDGLHNLAGGTITGALSGIQVVSGDLMNTTNAGTIEGLSNHGIRVYTGNINGLHNLAGGTIMGGLTGIQMTFGDLTNTSNAGTIEGLDGIVLVSGDLTNFENLTGGVIRGENSGITLADGNAINITNAGEISGGGATSTYAFYVANGGYLMNFTNTGIISSNGNGTSGGAIGSTGVITNFVNSGTITSLLPNGPANSNAIFGASIASLTNSGTIFSNLEGHAIYEGFGVDTLLTLLPGSVIQGRIDIDGLGGNTDTLVVGNGLNLATTLEKALPILNVNGALSASMLTSDGYLIVVADTSTLSAQDNALSDTTGAVSGVLVKQLEQSGSWERNVWLKAFGGISQTRASGPAAAVGHMYGGAIIGADTIFGDGVTLGLFGGFSAGALGASVANGQNIKNMSYFGGLYGKFDADGFYVDFGLTGGITTNDSSRLVANNLVLGGLETVMASYNSYFISPEFTIGTEMMNTGDIGFKPSLRMRYGFQHVDGYTEAGSSGSLILEGRNMHVFDARLQLAMPINNLGPDTIFELKTGVDGRFVVGGNSLNTMLLGNTTTGFNPGGAQHSVGGFIGADLSHAFSDTATLFASTEIGMSTETAFHADAEIGFKVSF